MTKQLPLRPAARVLIMNQGKVCLGHVSGSDGKLRCYNFPGGGVEEGATPESTVWQESLEEVGIEIRGIVDLGVELEQEHPFRDPERTKQYRGSVTMYYRAEYVRINRKFFNKEGDGMKYSWHTPAEAIRLIEQGPADPFNEVRIRALKML